MRRSKGTKLKVRCSSKERARREEAGQQWVLSGGRQAGEAREECSKRQEWEGDAK